MSEHASSHPRGLAVAEAYGDVRAHTEKLSASLSAEDQCIQSMPDASPTKWHRAHTTWFFEQFVLTPHALGYQPFDRDFSYLFNSYYEAIGARHPRPQRGLLSRPSADHVGRYRAYVDAAMAKLLTEPSDDVTHLVTLGLQHEQQHQELLMTDMLHALAQNPLLPTMLPGWTEPSFAPGPTRFITRRSGLAGMGHAGEGFCFDNELPRHQVLLQPHSLASRLVTNGEWQDFINNGGYTKPALWMAEGWDLTCREGWTAPMYWRQTSAGWQQFGPGGPAELNPDAPVRHVSWYEADAYARWTGFRLPTEAELEAGQSSLSDFTGHVWQWTNTAYGPYPGYRAPPGAVGEYNGKFMINQMVLRGGSMASPPGHARPSYRNFFHPDKRWQFTGLRLARDV